MLDHHHLTFVHMEPLLINHLRFELNLETLSFVVSSRSYSCLMSVSVPMFVDVVVVVLLLYLYLYLSFFSLLTVVFDCVVSCSSFVVVLVLALSLSLVLLLRILTFDDDYDDVVKKREGI